MAKRILFVDDKTQVEGWQTCLKRDLNVDSDVAQSIEEVVTFMTNNSYDCVILEPHKKGFRGRKRENPSFALMKYVNAKGVPLIIGSTYVERDFRASFGLERETDYAGYKTKPWSEQEIVEEVQRVLQGR